MQGALNIVHENPQILVFLTLGLGYFLGKVKIRGFSLGVTTCVLLTALVLGQIGVDIPEILKTISFALFIFAVGYKVGPQFFGSLKKEGVKYLWISLVVAFTALGATIFLGRALHFDKGTTAGLFAGSVTQSAAIGTAEGAINHLSITDADKDTLDTNVAVAYAITYVFGTAGTLVLLKIMPKVFGISLKDEARKLEESMGARNNDENEGIFSWHESLDLRSYTVLNPEVFGKKISEVEDMFPARVAIDRIKQGGKIFSPASDTVVNKSDIVSVIGKCENIIDAQKIIGPEINNKETRDVTGEVLKVCVMRPAIAGKTLGELAKTKEAHGVFLRRITRQGHELPITRDTVIHKSDVFQIVGSKSDVERVVDLIGYPERPTSITDLVMVGVGCTLGTLIGLISVPLFGIPITLGVGGGVLIAGVIFGWLRTVHPTFGQISSGGQWILSDLGLNLFIACVGLGAGQAAVKALQTTGLSVFLAGTIVAVLPVIIGLYFGKYVLKMNPVLLFGAVAGARVLSAALNQLQEESESTMPVLGYGAPYAFGNILLTVWGTIIISVM